MLVRARPGEWLHSMRYKSSSEVDLEHPATKEEAVFHSWRIMIYLMSSNTFCCFFLFFFFSHFRPTILTNLHTWPRRKLRDDSSKAGHAQCKWHEWWRSRSKPKIYQTLSKESGYEAILLSSWFVVHSCDLAWILNYRWDQVWVFPIICTPMITATLMTRN